jgi:hypothetical protein
MCRNRSALPRPVSGMRDRSASGISHESSRVLACIGGIPPVRRWRSHHLPDVPSSSMPHAPEGPPWGSPPQRGLESYTTGYTRTACLGNQNQARDQATQALGGSPLAVSVPPIHATCRPDARPAAVPPRHQANKNPAAPVTKPNRRRQFLAQETVGVSSKLSLIESPRGRRDDRGALMLADCARLPNLTVVLPVADLAETSAANGPADQAVRQQVPPPAVPPAPGGL